MEQEKQDKVLLLAVALNPETNTYSVDVAKGSNVNETAFCMAVVIKCLLKDNIIDDAKQVTDLITKYLTDPQYDELKEEENVDD